MELIVSLIMVPCVAALLMLVVRADKARDVLCVASAAVIALLSIAFAVQIWARVRCISTFPWSTATSLP